MSNPIRIIVRAIEGTFMLDRDFTDGASATTFARQVGFRNYEITNDYESSDWTPLNPALDPTKVMSFMRKKGVAVCQ